MEERIKSKLEFSYAPEVYYDISDKTEKKWFYTEKGLNLVKNHKGTNNNIFSCFSADVRRFIFSFVGQCA